MNKFYTLKGYSQADCNELTPAMEDYLEMICRMKKNGGEVKIRDLSRLLNVRPSSASKMVKNLCDAGYIKAQRYGSILLTEKGVSEGKYLLYRHNVIHGFLCFLNKTENRLDEAEKIEHFLSRMTVFNLDMLLSELKKQQSFH